MSGNYTSGIKVSSPRRWEIVLTPDERYDWSGTNRGGILVHVQKTDGTARSEVSRVGYIRSASENPGRTFDQQLQKEIKRATKALNALHRSPIPTV